MARRCPTCRAPMKQEIVFHRKIGLDNRPQLYHYVRRYTCPEGCTVRLDFSKAKPLRPGVRPMVLPKIEPLKKKADFNDKLLAVGLGLALVLFIAGIFMSPVPLAAQLAAVAGLLLFTAGLYTFANRRVVLPESFPRPIPEPAPVVQEVRVEEKVPAAAAAQAAPKKKSKPAQVEIPDVIPPLPRVEGEPIRMWVVLDGEEYELEVNEGELILDAALEREVELDYSCREGMCDSCMVRVLAGLENVSPPTQEEIDMLGDDVKRGFRLSCQARLKGPVKVMQE